YFRSELEKAVGGHRNVGEVRGYGLMAAIEFVEDRDDRTFFDAGILDNAEFVDQFEIGNTCGSTDRVGRIGPAVTDRAHLIGTLHQDL
ncbi:hypothetical protein ACC736_38155, partial [Rhizobium ruizarguesonis]